MNSRLQADVDPDSLFELNRAKLKKIFSKHFPNKEGKVTFPEFTRFCKNSKIYPDLMSMLELKRIIVRLSSATQTNKITLSYPQFEHTLKHIAVSTFNSTIPLEDKLRMLLIHMKNPCKQEYQVSLTCNADDSRPTSHSSELDESDDYRQASHSRSSLGTFSHSKTAIASRTALDKTLKITLDLSAAAKTPASYSSQAKQKYFSTSPSRDRQNSVKTLMKMTPVPKKNGSVAQSFAQVGMASPVEVIDSGSPTVKVKLPMSPRAPAKTKAVPLFHVTLDKQKTPRRKEAADRKHLRTLSAGYHFLESPRFGVSALSRGKTVAEISPVASNSFMSNKNSSPQIETPSKPGSLSDIQEAISAFSEKYEDWKTTGPQSKGRPQLTLIRKQREWIGRTASTWFTSVRFRQEFVLKLILRGWKNYVVTKDRTAGIQDSP